MEHKNTVIMLSNIIKEILDEESEAAKKAKGMGLTNMGFGRWGKDGKVTHKSDGTSLLPVQPAAAQKTKAATSTPQTKSQMAAKPDARVAASAARNKNRDVFPEIPDKVKQSYAGAGKDISKQEYRNMLDKSLTDKLQSRIKLSPLPKQAAKHDTIENSEKNFNSTLAKFKMKQGDLPPRTANGTVEPKFIAAMLKHEKQFPYSNFVKQTYFGAQGERPMWLPQVYK